MNRCGAKGIPRYYIQPFVQSIVVLPLYPQDARSSTGNALDAATAAMQALG